MAEQAPKKPFRSHLFICGGKSCSEKGDPEACKKYFKEKIKELGFKDEVRACTSSCLDRCDDGPNIVVYPEATWYSGVKSTDWPDILKRHVLKREVVK